MSEAHFKKREEVMANSTRWFGWTIVVMVLHMAEQLRFGLVELDRLKRLVALYDGWFSSVDTATVVLVTIGATLIYGAIFSILKGGRARFVALGVLGVFSVAEVHHVIETILAGGYTPGFVTSIPYTVCGVLFLRALIQESRAGATASESRSVGQPAILV
jgi:hypothetical protein